MCPNLHRNNEGGVGRNWEHGRISTKKSLKSASKPLKTAENCIFANPKFNFFWRKRGPQTPHQTCVYGTHERPPVSPVLHVARIPTFKHLASSLLWDFCRCFHSETGSENEKLSLMLLVHTDRYDCHYYNDHFVCLFEEVMLFMCRCWRNLPKMTVLSRWMLRREEWSILSIRERLNKCSKSDAGRRLLSRSASFPYIVSVFYSPIFNLFIGVRRLWNLSLVAVN